MTAAELHATRSSEALEGERRFILHDVPWTTYVVLRDTLEEHSGLKLTYLEGTLELMSPSGDHEDLKKIIARLLEAWAEEMDVDLNGRGGQTFRTEAKRRGLEPDECYCVGPFGAIPEIAIEVVITSGLVDKLEVYRGLGVRELWVWQDGALTVYRLTGDRYEAHERSSILPALDVPHLTSFVATGVSQTKTTKAYRAALRARLAAPPGRPPGT
ncbi:MAG: Uma2 family endonuclease [Polyangiaceae bacterium]